MSKFKVGDRVKVISNSYIVGIYKTQEGYITKVIESKSSNDRIYKVNLINYANVVDKTSDIEPNEKVQLLNWFYEYELELVNESVADQVLKHINITGGNKMENELKSVIMPTFEEVLNGYDENMVYIGGHMLNKANAKQRTVESEEIKSLGYKTWNPIEDKSINSKNGLDKHTNDNLSKRIVRNDVTGILRSGKIVIEPECMAIGTLVETGKIFAYSHIAEMLKQILESNKDNNLGLLYDLQRLITMCDKDVYPHIDDLRAENGVEELNYNRSWGVNQYLRGTTQALTNKEEGFYSWEDIIKELRK